MLTSQGLVSHEKSGGTPGLSKRNAIKVEPGVLKMLEREKLQTDTNFPMTWETNNSDLAVSLSSQS